MCAYRTSSVVFVLFALKFCLQLFHPRLITYFAMPRGRWWDSELRWREQKMQEEEKASSIQLLSSSAIPLWLQFALHFGRKSFFRRIHERQVIFWRLFAVIWTVWREMSLWLEFSDWRHFIWNHFYLRGRLRSSLTTYSSFFSNSFLGQEIMTRYEDNCEPDSSF